jgi:hypothetical protein
LKALAVCWIVFLLAAVLAYATYSKQREIIQTVIKEPKEIKIFIDQPKEKSFEFAVERDTAIQEVSSYWTYIFDKETCPTNDWRRQKFNEWASWLVDAIRDYQSEKNNTELKLPNYRYLHLLIAYIVYKESSVNPNVIGNRFGEVGFLQLHGVSLNGYLPEVIIETPQLGMQLGIRWLAYTYNQCGKLDNTLDSWLGPLALYAAGPKAKTNGKCSISFSYAIDKVSETKKYISNNIEI